MWDGRVVWDCGLGRVVWDCVVWDGRNLNTFHARSGAVLTALKASNTTAANSWSTSVQVTSVPEVPTGDPSTWDDCPEFTDSDFWENSIDAETGAPHPGKNYAGIIYNLNSDMANGGPEVRNYPILTNPWGIDGFWDATDTSAYPDGQYQVTVRVLDQSGRMDQLTRWVYLGNGSDCTCDDLPQAIYVRDSLDDDGAVPSETPWWRSKDLVILPHGSGRPSTENSSGVASNAVDTNETYDVWVRVHRLNCAPTEEIEAEVMALKPAMILDPEDPEAETEYITNGYDSGDNAFIGFPLGGPDFEYIGPFEWTPKATGHRCLLGRVKFASEDADDVEGESVEEDRRYAQRNLQDVGGGTEFKIVNPLQQTADIAIEFDSRNFPILEPGAQVTLTVEYNSTLHVAWADAPGTQMSINASGNIELTFNARRVKLPAATLPGLIRLNAWVDLVLPEGIVGTYEVYFSEYVNNELRGGMSFTINELIII